MPIASSASSCSVFILQSPLCGLQSYAWLSRTSSHPARTQAHSPRRCCHHPHLLRRCAPPHSPATHGAVVQGVSSSQTLHSAQAHRISQGLIYLFVITLAISLRVDGLFETPLLVAISASFFLLEKSARHMQDPFENRPTDTAMTSISRKIEINIRQLLKDTEIPQAYQAEKFYLL